MIERREQRACALAISIDVAAVKVRGRRLLVELRELVRVLELAGQGAADMGDGRLVTQGCETAEHDAAGEQQRDRAPASPYLHVDCV